MILQVLVIIAVQECSNEFALTEKITLYKTIVKMGNPIQKKDDLEHGFQINTKFGTVVADKRGTLALCQILGNLGKWLSSYNLK